MKRNHIIWTYLILLPILGGAQSTKEINYVSSADGSKQPAMFYAPSGKKSVPLLVALHSWSANYRQNLHRECINWAIKKGWAVIHPNFRGPNRRPEACGSDLVVSDIVDAVEYAKKNASIDTKSIYLVGTSGGGYTALMMAGRKPKIWAGVSVWVPISDLKAWHAECKAKKRNYYKDIEKSCGGPPGKSKAVDAEYTKRSPLTHLANAKGLKLHINAGIHDGHQCSVPISHSLRAFNNLAEAKDQISEADITYFTSKAKVPPSLRQAISDPSYGNKKPLFRRTSGNAAITIFDGGHQLVPSAAIAWIESIHKDRK